jgi:cysteine desulfurase
VFVYGNQTFACCNQTWSVIISTTEPIYLDWAATTPTDPRVAKLVYQMMTEGFGNPHSRTHQRGSDAAKVVQKARSQVAAVVDVDPSEIIFTSGATESNNLAILGLENALRESNKTHIITSAIEHKAVLEPIERLEQRGFRVTYIQPDTQCIVNPIDIANALTDETGLVSIMAVNNEIGSIQPLAEIAKTLADHPAFFHTDAAQAFGKELNLLRNRRIDLISISGHKICAPMGIGALVSKRRQYIRPPIMGLQLGGGQERGLRGGTVAMPLVAGLGLASEIMLKEHRNWKLICCESRKSIIYCINEMSGVVHTPTSKAVPNIISFRIPSIMSEVAIFKLKLSIACSSGSACTSSKIEPSHVLKSMNLSASECLETIRFSWGAKIFDASQLLLALKTL